MKILMIGPMPYFQPRGTPFSTRQRLAALSKLGHRVDLLSYRFGIDVPLPGLRHFRIPRVPGIHHIRIGPSYPKIVLDVVLFWRAAWMLLVGRYDCVHTHEEASVMGALARIFLRVPHVYDMHSSLPQQFVNYNFTHDRLFLGFVRWLERWVIAHSDCVITICPYLEDLVRRISPDSRVFLVENLPVSTGGDIVPAERARAAAERLGVAGSTVVVYAGTLEFNQGMDILLEAMALLDRERHSVKLLLVGGEKSQVEALSAYGKRLGVDSDVVFTGRRPLEEMPLYMEMADILVSPRKIGTNTPLKIYSYMWAGRPIVATDLATHTQVLSADTALLAEPNAESFAAAVGRLLEDPELGRRLGRAARARAEQKHNPQRYLEKVKEVTTCVAGR